MADNQLDILIRILAETNGADQVAASLKKVTAAAKENAAAQDSIYSKNEKYVFVAQKMKDGQADLSKTTKELDANVRGAAQAVDQLTLSKHALRDIAKGLSHEFPILGAAVRLFTHPLAAVVALLTASIALFIKMRQDAAAMAKDVDFTPMRNQLRGLAEGASLAGDRLASLAEAVIRYDGLRRQATDNDDLAKTILNLEAEAAGKLAEALGDTAEAQERRARALRDSLAAEEELQIKRKEEEREAERKQNVGFFSARLDAESELANRKNALKDTQTEMAALDEKRKATGRLRPDEQQRYGQLRRLSYAQELTVPEAQANLDAAIAREKAGTERVNALGTEIDTRRTKLGSSRAAAARSDELSGRTGRVAGAVTGFFEGGGSLAGSGGATPANMLAEFQGAVQALAASRMETQQLITILTNIFKDGVVTAPELAALKQAVANQRSQ